MKIPSFRTLQKSDPSQVNGWLIAVFGAVLGFLGTLTPQLDGVQGWSNAWPIIIGAALPKLTAALISLDASKPSTVESLVDDAEARGKEAARQQAKAARSQAAQKGVMTKAQKASDDTPKESKPDSKPKVRKRPKAKPSPSLHPTQSRTTQGS